MKRLLAAALIPCIVAVPAMGATVTQFFSLPLPTGGTSVSASVSQNATGGSAAFGLINVDDSVSTTRGATQTFSLPGFTVANAQLKAVQWSFAVANSSESQASAVCINASLSNTACDSAARTVVQSGFGIEVPGSASAADPVLGPPGGPSSAPGGGGAIFTIAGDATRTFTQTLRVDSGGIISCIFNGANCGSVSRGSRDQTVSLSIADRWFDAYRAPTIDFSISAAVQQTLSASCNATGLFVQCMAEGSAEATIRLLSASVFYIYEVGAPDPGVGQDTGSGLGGTPGTGGGPITGDPGGVPAITPVPLPAPALMLLSGLALMTLGARRAGNARSRRVASTKVAKT